MYQVFLELMKQKGVNAAQVAKSTGIAGSTLSDWKNGRSKPKADKLMTLAEYFGVSIETFMKG